MKTWKSIKSNVQSIYAIACMTPSQRSLSEQGWIIYICLTI